NALTSNTRGAACLLCVGSPPGTVPPKRSRLIASRAKAAVHQPAAGQFPSSPRSLVVIPTYNEHECRGLRAFGAVLRNPGSRQPRARALDRHTGRPDRPGRAPADAPIHGARIRGDRTG